MVKKLILIFVFLFSGCVNYDAYYRAIEAEANRPSPPMFRVTHPDGTLIEVADMRPRRVIPPPPNPWENIGRDILQALVMGGTMWTQYEMNESNQATQQKMFEAFESSNKSPAGPKFGDVNGNIIYGSDNQQADRIGSDYDYRWEFQDNSDHSNVWPSTVLRPEVVSRDVAVQIPTQVVTTERVVYP